MPIGQLLRLSVTEEVNMTTFIDGQPDSGVLLVGIDFSDLSDGALRTAAGIAAHRATFELHVVHVLPDGPALALPPLPEANTLDASLRRSGAPGQVETPRDIGARVTELVARAAPSMKHVTVHVRTGVPDIQIAQLASDLSADLIIVGTHSRQGLARLLLGSVAESLVRNAPCPVLTYRPKAVSAWEKILPPCPDCLEVQRKTARARLWCDRHSQHHDLAHTYNLVPESYGIGSQTFREP
jgi:nucleotide-binding universal stress UspA family protein